MGLVILIVFHAKMDMFSMKILENASLITVLEVTNGIEGTQHQDHGRKVVFHIDILGILTAFIVLVVLM